MSGARTLQADSEVSLAIGGMTCGACVARVERALNGLDGVQAQVNFATARATVELARELPVERLLEQVASAGYHAELLDQGQAAGQLDLSELERRMRALRRRLVVAAVLFMPLCDTSIAFSLYPALRFAGWQWLMVALAAPVVTWAAWPFYDAAVRNARHGVATMDTLVSMGIVAATGWSFYSMFAVDTGAHGSTLLGLAHGAGGGIYLDVPAGVTTFLLAGRFFEAWSRRRSGQALGALAAVGARDVAVLDASGHEQQRSVSSLAVGELFVVRPGETVATDGEVRTGQAAVDRSVMTGESRPVEVAAGDPVLGGTVSLTGRIVVEATSVGRDTQLGQMMRLVEHAQNQKAAIQQLADRVSGVFVPAVLLIALATLITWLGTGNPAAVAFNASVSVLIIACPCALGLATPAALVVASWSGARLGIFFKDYRALEASRAVDTVVFDKTGTLTEGRMALSDLQAVGEVDQKTLLRLAGAVESASEHPVGRAIAAEATRSVGELPAVDAFVALPGIGARGIVEGRALYVGRLGGDDGAHGSDLLPSALGERCEQWERLGRTVVVVSRDAAVIGALALADTIRPSAASAVRELEALGLRCVLLTGDNEQTAAAVGATVGITEVLAEALPTEKVAIVRTLQRQGRRVAMVGDGVNDAPVLAAADLGLAVGSGTDAAINAADLIILRDDLTVVASAIGLARRTLRTIKGNLAWAFLYNLAALPLAAFGLLDPLVAGGAMALSSSFVVYNSSRLRIAPPAFDRSPMSVSPAPGGDTVRGAEPISAPSGGG